jgi:hypothetical protein
MLLSDKYKKKKKKSPRRNPMAEVKTIQPIDVLNDGHAQIFMRNSSVKALYDAAQQGNKGEFVSRLLSMLERKVDNNQLLRKE